MGEKWGQSPFFFGCLHGRFLPHDRRPFLCDSTIPLSFIQINSKSGSTEFSPSRTLSPFTISHVAKKTVSLFPLRRSQSSRKCPPSSLSHRERVRVRARVPIPISAFS